MHKQPPCDPGVLVGERNSGKVGMQIRTHFQHAWSEADHDLCYKANYKLSPAQLHQCAFTAAQAWGADRVLTELGAEIAAANPPRQAATGKASGQQ